MPAVRPTLGDQIADDTGSGNDAVIDLDLELDGAAQTAALILVCWEPLYLPATYTTIGQPRHKHIVGRVLLADGSSPYRDRSYAALGFGELAEELAYPRGSSSGNANNPREGGIPAGHIKHSWTPGGFKAETFLLCPDPAGDPIDQFRLHWDELTPRVSHDVDWFSVKAWQLLDFDPDFESLSGLRIRGAVEPDVYKEGLDPFDYHVHYCTGVGDVSVGEFPADGSVIVMDPVAIEPMGPLDGGEVAGIEQPGTTSPHAYDIGLAGRWGDGGTGTWTWADNHAAWTLLETVDRTQADGNHAHVEMFVRFFPAASIGSFRPHGTFGTQSSGGTGDATDYRWTGPLLRAASTWSDYTVPGGWLPQIYRRMVETEVG